MCGIVGEVSLGPPVEAERLARQRDTMRHRGPDSSGAWLSPDQRVGLGHRRLAIIDLSEAGHQPMLDPLSGNCITFNGEIYNFRALRDELRGFGAQFRSESDTEVILAAYRLWGTAAIARLDGMFAFAIFDPRRRCVVLARDRAGEKPLYLWRHPDGLSFASECKAFMADGRFARRVDRHALNEYLTYGYVSGGGALFEGVTKLPPASWLEVDLDSGKMTASTYWVLPSMVAARERSTSDQLTDDLEAMLGDAVARQLVADVPVGVLLSGGVDSSIIAALAARTSSRPVRTFTVRFPGHPDKDEGPFARLVAEHLGTEHMELEAPASDESLFRALVTQFDEPLADSSMIPTYLVSRAIREHATVAIGGDGGDELFGGYRKYSAQLSYTKWRSRMPRAARKALAYSASRWLPEDMPGATYLTALAEDPAHMIAMGGVMFRSQWRRDLLGLDSVSATAPERRRAAMVRATGSLLQRSTATDFQTYLVDDILVKVDRASMLASLEVRAPFLDRSVVEFAFSAVPDAFKASAEYRKRLLRLLGQRLLPPELDLTRKQGFEIPLHEWIRGPWRGVLHELAARPTTLFTYNPLGQLLTEFGRRPVFADRIFAISVLLLWEEIYGVTG